MASLKEIKTRIGSVKGTLKITSAMKMVASAKLHRAQQAVQGMLPYQKALNGMLSTVAAGGIQVGPERTEEKEQPRIVILAVSSNSSLCGGFNANVVRKVLETLREYHAAGIPDAQVTVVPIGRKMADAMRKINRSAALTSDLNHLIDKPSFAEAASFAEKVYARFREGKIDRVELIYNHFVSTASQVPVRETWLPFAVSGAPSAVSGEGGQSPSDRLWLLEPSREALLEELIPKLIRLKIFTMLLDSSAAEHAARTVAMQTATDNGEDILDELTLEYNKGRQQKITSELLDIVGGSMQG